MAKETSFSKAKHTVLESLEEIQISLVRCVQEGMIDSDASYYNELLGLIDETRICRDWAELAEVIAKSKSLEVDIASWLSRKGRTSLSLPWPLIEQDKN